MQESIKILKVRFDKTTLEEATNKAISWAQGKERRLITTPNPEIVLAAQDNKKFLRTLNQSDLNIADGTGIVWASKFLHCTEKSGYIMKRIKFFYTLMQVLCCPKKIRTVLPHRVTGADLTVEICKEASRKNIKIFMLGAREGVAEIAKEKLLKKFPRLKIVGTYAGTPKKREEKEIINRINKAAPHILFVAYGAPAQEMWIMRNYKKLRTVKVAIGVGGTFNFLAGKLKRAPRWMQHLGLEWLYRLIQQPRRIKRILNATVVFPLKVLKHS